LYLEEKEENVRLIRKEKEEKDEYYRIEISPSPGYTQRVERMSVEGDMERSMKRA
jgi:hypothetical protein